MRVAIVGSRDFKNLTQVVMFVERLPTGTVVVSGGARGVDRTAEQAAKGCCLEVQSVPADWSGLGKAAGMIRNRAIVRWSDAVVAFWDGKSKGTANTIKVAATLGKPTKIYYDDGKIDASPNWFDIEGSSSGRTPGSGPGYVGSIPAPSAL